MWSKASSSFALLFAVLAASASVSVSAQNAATGSDVLVTMPIQIDGSFKDLQLMRGESVEDAAVSFARNNGLLTNRDATRVREVVDQLSGLLRGRMEEIRATEPAPKPTVQLSMPLTIDGTTRELKKLEGETVEAAVERFLYDGGYTMDVMRQLYPQLVNVVLQKLEELKPARKELFSFTLTIDGREAITRHFENGDPLEEARETLRGVDIVDATLVERLAPQIANEIRKRIPESSPAPAQPVAAAQPAAAPPTNELFSIPLTVNEKPTVLVHYEGYTSRESAVRYLNENGLANADTAPQMVTQLVQIIDSRIAEIARETQAAQEAAAARAEVEQEQQQAAARTAEEAAAATRRQPTVRLPVNFGNDQAATLDYYEGDSVERTVELFLTQIGMQESSTFAQNVEALASAVRKELATIAAKREAAQASTSEPQEKEPQPLITLPVTLSGRVFDLVYFAGEQPATVANAFCVEKHEIIRTEMGLQFDGDQLAECKTLLDQTLRNLIAQKRKEKENEPQPAASQATRSRGEFLFSLDIELNNANVPLTMHQNDNAEQVARAFCEQHKIDLANVAPLVRALNEQLARLK